MALGHWLVTVTTFRQPAAILSYLQALQPNPYCWQAAVEQLAELLGVDSATIHSAMKQGICGAGHWNGGLFISSRDCRSCTSSSCYSG
jgi:hypothetical protein